VEVAEREGSLLQMTKLRELTITRLRQFSLARNLIQNFSGVFVVVEHLFLLSTHVMLSLFKLTKVLIFD
jgi:hypothetical protein